MKTFMKYMLLPLMMLVAPAVPASDVSPMSVQGATTVDTAAATALFDKEVVFVDTRLVSRLTSVSLRCRAS